MVHMDLFRRVALVLVTILIAAPAFAQIDLSGEWVVKNREKCLTLLVASLRSAAT
jgi:hypothetical protein